MVIINTTVLVAVIAFLFFFFFMELSRYPRKNPYSKQDFNGSENCHYMRILLGTSELMVD